MRSLIPVFTFALASALMISCEPTETSTKNTANFQAISMLGDSLFSPESSLNPKLSARLDSLIGQAESNGDAVTALIWKARRLGYQGRYRSAIELLGTGISSDPNEARLYRHRGHRYITVRDLDKAVVDLEKAAELTEGTEDIIEPDGLPNAQNIPLSTLQTNIYYHLGLAYFLQDRFEEASKAYDRGLSLTTNDDMKTAFLYWHYITLRKQGKDVLAGQVLGQVTEDMTIIENQSYYDLLRVFKGEFDEASLLDASETALDNATVGYGLGFWHDINGRHERAQEIWTGVYESGPWAAFGYIASEAELVAAQ